MLKLFTARRAFDAARYAIAVQAIESLRSSCGFA